MRKGTGIAVVVIACACGPAMGAAMSRDDYQAAKKRIAAEYQAERQKCGVRHGNDLDLCVAHAKGTRNVAQAELQAAYKPTARKDYDAAIARAKAAFSVAKEECDEKSGAAKSACMKDAKAAYSRARVEAKNAMAVNRAEEKAKASAR